MGTPCKKCGMESDRDDICTWCNADLKPKPAAETGKPAQAAAKPTSPAPSARSAPAATPPKRVYWTWLAPVLIVALAAIAYPLFIVGTKASAPLPPPGDWQTFTAKDNSFSASYPAGWGQPSNSGSAGSYVLVEWKAGRLAKIQVKGSQVAGSVGDVAAAKERAMAGEGGPIAIEMTADGTLLEFFNKDNAFAKPRSGYEEGQMQEAHDFAGVRSACAEYTYARRIGLVSVKMKGLRWASFQGDYGYNVWAEAPEKHWETFKPVAQQIVGSVKLGGKAG
jgi:hypothetical protein